MNPLRYLVIHCLATPNGIPVTVDRLRQMHMGPRELTGGAVQYLGLRYQSRSALPADRIGGVLVRDLTGRGWDRLGYRALIHANGQVERLVPANRNAFVEPGEITWGVGPEVNPVGHHIALEGGLSPDGKQIQSPLTAANRKALQEVVRDYLSFAPAVAIAGHNQFANKACPSFWVPSLLREWEVPETNIYTKDPYGYKRFYNA